MDDRRPTTGARRMPNGPRRKRRHAAARSRVLAGALSAVAFLGLGVRMAVHGGSAKGATNTSLTSSSTSDGSSVDDTPSSDDDTGSSWTANSGSTSSTVPDITSHGS